jgi:arylsulfatase
MVRHSLAFTLWLLSLLTGTTLTSVAGAQETAGVPGSPGATTTIDGRYLPNPPQQFKGEINTNANKSKPYWPQLIVPPKGAPNILLIMTDDVAFPRRLPSAA